MRVSILQTEEKRGLFSQKTAFMVEVTIEFSDEEQTIVRTKKLEEVEFATYRFRGDKMELNIKDFLRNPIKFHFETFIEAQNFDAHMREGLRELKRVLDAGAHATPGRADTFEL